MKYLLQGIVIGILSLFLLSRTPIADLSSNVSGNALNTKIVTPVDTLKTPEKVKVSGLNTRVFANFSQNTLTQKNPQQSQSAQQTKTAPQISYSKPQSTQTTSHSNTTQTAPDQVNILGATSPLFAASVEGGILSETGTKIGLYGKFLYGHLTTSVFRNLPQLTVGNTFTISQNGETRTYEVKLKETIEKPICNPAKNGKPAETSGCATFNKIRTATYKGSYDLALMTCAGTLYTSGDASHRLIIMANRIN